MRLRVQASHLPALVLGGALAALALDWMWLAGPQCAALGEARARLAALRIELAAARREAATRADTKRTVRDAARALRRAASRLPEQRELGALLASVADGARDAGLELLRLRPRPERAAGDHVEVPVELEMRGTYLGVLEFLHRLDGLGRLVRVGDLRIERPEPAEQRSSQKTGQGERPGAPQDAPRNTTDPVVLQIRCTALTYRLPRVAERRAAHAPSTGDRG
jgi:Tfp pilus assembly protein PilO